MDAINMISHGIYLIGSSDGDHKNLMTAAWLAQASSNMVMLSVGKKHYTAELIGNSRHFSISILSDADRKFAQCCGTVSGRFVDKLSGLPIRFTAEGDPILATAPAHLSCRVEHIVNQFDHTIFIAKIISSDAISANCLNYRKGEWF